MPSIESVISNEDITELCRKLPSSMEELEQDEI